MTDMFLWRRYSPSLHREIDQLPIEDRIFYSFLDPFDFTLFYLSERIPKKVSDANTLYCPYLKENIYLPRPNSLPNSQNYTLVGYRTDVQLDYRNPTSLIVSNDSPLLILGQWDDRERIFNTYTKRSIIKDAPPTRLLIIANALRAYWLKLKQQNLLTDYELVKTCCTHIDSGGYHSWFTEPISYLSLVRRKSRLNAITNSKKS